MFIIYIVNNFGFGAYGSATHDLTCGPSESFWLVPGTESLLDEEGNVRWGILE